MTYTSLELVDFGAGGQIYGSLEGTLSGDRLAGQVRATNLAPLRPDYVALPTIRGVLTTEDGASIWLTSDGVSTQRETDGVRVFVTSLLLRTGDPRYRWVNTVYAVTEGVLESAGVGEVARSVVWECRPSVG